MAGAAWVCCQLGAREHYAVPRALHRRGRLAQLVTDAWVPAGLLAGWAGRLGQRYHPELADAPVRALTGSLVLHEMAWRGRRRRDWDLVLARNRWFQRAAAARLPEPRGGTATLLFAHSYSAGQILQEGRRRGWRTVLGQIDPGPGHYAIQAERAARWPEFGPPPDPPPAPYFDGWRTECELADRIVVNSDWSRELLVAAGVDGGRISVVPLPYDQPLATAGSRSYPAAFSADRPLRVLFVGTASVTKGVPELLHAIDLLRGAPIELTLVGGVALTTPRRFAADRRIRWAGAVDRRRVMSYYRESDVLVFPSHSDGFGMAQVEAQAWWLPIIASRRCGRVVRDGETGWLLGDVTPTAIADALDQAMASPAVLARYADAARGLAEAGFQDLSDGLARLESA